jgi:hypothetical protein
MALKNSRPPFYRELVGYFSKLHHKNAYITIGYNIERA